MVENTTQRAERQLRAKRDTRLKRDVFFGESAAAKARRRKKSKDSSSNFAKSEAQKAKIAQDEVSRNALVEQEAKTQARLREQQLSKIQNEFNVDRTTAFYIAKNPRDLQVRSFISKAQRLRSGRATPRELAQFAKDVALQQARFGVKVFSDSKLRAQAQTQGIVNREFRRSVERAPQIIGGLSQASEERKRQSAQLIERARALKQPLIGRFGPTTTLAKKNTKLDALNNKIQELRQQNTKIATLTSNFIQKGANNYQKFAGKSIYTLPSRFLVKTVAETLQVIPATIDAAGRIQSTSAFVLLSLAGGKKKEVLDFLKEQNKISSTSASFAAKEAIKDPITYIFALTGVRPKIKTKVNDQTKVKIVNTLPKTPLANTFYITRKNKTLSLVDKAKKIIFTKSYPQKYKVGQLKKPIEFIIKSKRPRIKGKLKLQKKQQRKKFIQQAKIDTRKEKIKRATIQSPSRLKKQRRKLRKEQRKEILTREGLRVEILNKPFKIIKNTIVPLQKTKNAAKSEIKIKSKVAKRQKGTFEQKTTKKAVNLEKLFNNAKKKYGKNNVIAFENNAVKKAVLRTPEKTRYFKKQSVNLTTFNGQVLQAMQWVEVIPKKAVKTKSVLKSKPLKLAQKTPVSSKTKTKQLQEVKQEIKQKSAQTQRTFNKTEQSFKQLQKTSSLQSLSTFQKIGSIYASISATKSLLKQAQQNKLQNRLTFFQFILNKNLVKTDTSQILLNKLKQLQKLNIRQVFKPIFKTPLPKRKPTKPQQKVLFKPRRQISSKNLKKTIVKKPRKPKGSLFKLPRFDELKIIKNKPYDIYIRTKSKLVKFNPKPLKGADVERVARFVVDRHLSRSYVIKPTTGKTQSVPKRINAPESYFRKPKGKTTLNKKSRVERRKYALNTQSEVKRLALAKIRAQVFKKPKNKRKTIKRK